MKAENLMTREDVAIALRCSCSKVDKLRQNGDIVIHERSGLKRYLRSEIEEFIASFQPVEVQQN